MRVLSCAVVGCDGLGVGGWPIPEAEFTRLLILDSDTVPQALGIKGTLEISDLAIAR